MAMSSLEYKKTFFKVADFVSWQSNKTLVLSPKFQRRSVWKAGAKSYLIDTIVKNLPIPIIFLRDKPIDINTMKAVREVIDGQQRLRTVLSFVKPELLDDYDPKKDEFFVKRFHNEDISGKAFQNLDPEIQQSILDYEFSVHILSPRIDDRDVIEIFRRMNSIYYKLNPQELRNSQYFGVFKTLAYRLAEECLNYWRSWNIYNDDDIARMKEVQLTSELLIMIINEDIESTTENKIDRFYEQYDSELIHQEEVYEKFMLTMANIDNGFKDFLPRSIFSQKTKIYVFFALIYQILFGLNQYPKSSTKEYLQEGYLGLRLTHETIEKIKKICQTIENNKSSLNPDVVKALESRREGTTERRAIFNYLLLQLNNSESSSEFIL